MGKIKRGDGTRRYKEAIRARLASIKNIKNPAPIASPNVVEDS